MGRLIAIGDVHGCYNTLKELLKKVEYDAKTDTLVFVGDYIDRGKNSYEAVAFIRDLESANKHKVVCLRGNHEQMAIDAHRRGKFDLWIYNGGQTTLNSFEANGEDIESAIAWFETLPLVYDTPQIIFCHAGLTHPKLDDNSKDDLIWGREWIHTDNEPREKQVVFGHTPSRKGTAYMVDTGDICIDSACVYGGNLCALVIQDNGESKCVYEPKSEKDNLF